MAISANNPVCTFRNLAYATNRFRLFGQQEGDFASPSAGELSFYPLPMGEFVISGNYLPD